MPRTTRLTRREQAVRTARPLERLDVCEARPGQFIPCYLSETQRTTKDTKHTKETELNRVRRPSIVSLLLCRLCVLRVLCVLGALCVVCVSPAMTIAQVRVESPEGGEVDPFTAPASTKAIVFLFTSTDCPISNRYAPDVRKLAAKFGPKGVLFRLVYPDPADTRTRILDHMTAFAYAGATQALRDPKHALVRFTGVSVTPEAAVYAGGRVVYHGRIDDRYADLGLERPAATVHDLDEALTAVLAGRAVERPITPAVGCYIADFRQ